MQWGRFFDRISVPKESSPLYIAQHMLKEKDFYDADHTTFDIYL